MTITKLDRSFLLISVCIWTWIGQPVLRRRSVDAAEEKRRGGDAFRIGRRPVDVERSVSQSVPTL